ncbi:MAG: IS1182 family transposase [Chlorobium sp.]
MIKKFKTVDHVATLDSTIRLGDCLPPDHLACFVVDLVTQLDLSGFYERYSKKGGSAYDPKVLLGLLFYAYATGVFSSRRLERATYEQIPFRYLAGNLHPDHDTLANFRKTFLPQLKDLFVQILLLAQTAGVLKLGNISLDGTKIHADASKSRAVSYKRLVELETQLKHDVAELFERAAQGDQPDGLVIEDEINLRQDRLARLAQAKLVLEGRAEERFVLEQVEYEVKVAEREAKTKKRGRKPGGRPPKPPTAGPRERDQYNFTDPQSRIMKNSTNKGFGQNYNAQLAVEQHSLVIVGYSLSNHPNDQAEIAPTVAVIPGVLGKPKAAALDNGYFSAANVAWLSGQGIEPYIATGRYPDHQSWRSYFEQTPLPPSPEASPKEKMAYKLKSMVGQAIYKLRKSTVEPVIGIIKEVIGFRQFSLRGEEAASGEWSLVCLAFNLKRLHKLGLG